MYLKIQVPRAHEVKNQCVISKRTSQIMKHGQDVIIQKWKDVYYPKWEVVLPVGAPDRVNIPFLMHDTRLCQMYVEMTKFLELMRSKINV